MIENGSCRYDYKYKKIGQAKIGHELSSETSLPNKFGEEFYDCPGFTDTNGVL